MIDLAILRLMHPRHFWWKREHVLVLGDSHADVFTHRLFRIHFPRSRFSFCIVEGATASGLENPNSKTQAGGKFSQALETTCPTLIVTLLGEVDTGFVIWYRAQKYQQSIDSMVDLAVENYSELLRSCRNVAPVIVVSAPLPTIRDGQNWGDVANLRKEISISLKERTELTVYFNRRLESLCQPLCCEFLDLDAECMGKDGTVDDRLLNRNCLNHHYAMDAYARILAPKLPVLLRRRSTLVAKREAVANSHL